MRKRVGRRLMWGGAVIALGIALAAALAIHAYGGADGAARADVIVVLGAGLQADGTPSPALVRRAAHGAALYAAGYAPAVVCAGGFTTPDVVSEAAACADLLRADGVPEAAIWLEEASFSTEENAIYTAALLREQGWASALLVSDRYHLWRARMLFAAQDVGVVGVSAAEITAGPVPPLEYGVSLGRELVALAWQVIKEALGLPFTHI